MISFLPAESSAASHADCLVHGHVCRSCNPIQATLVMFYKLIRRGPKAERVPPAALFWFGAFFLGGAVSQITGAVLEAAYYNLESGVAWCVRGIPCLFRILCIPCLHSCFCLSSSCDSSCVLFWGSCPLLAFLFRYQLACRSSAPCPTCLDVLPRSLTSCRWCCIQTNRTVMLMAVQLAALGAFNSGGVFYAMSVGRDKYSLTRPSARTFFQTGVVLFLITCIVVLLGMLRHIVVCSALVHMKVCVRWWCMWWWWWCVCVCV